MKSRHLKLTEIAAASELAADDPLRRHLEACVRCRTLSRRFEQFIARPGHVPVSDLRDAEERLAEFLANEVLPADATGASPARGRARDGSARERGTWAWFGAPALAVAAGVLVVSGALLIVQRPSGPGSRPSGVLRGQARGGSDAVMQRLAPVKLAEGRLELRWRGVPAADRYELRLYSPELRVLAVMGTSRETVFVLAPGAVAGGTTGDTLLWRVAALRGEVRLAQSDLGIVRLP